VDGSMVVISNPEP